MKSLLVLLAVAPLALYASACGGSGRSGSTAQSSSATTAPTSTVATSASDTTSPPALTKPDSDKDNDISAYKDKADNGEVLDYGRAASPADQRAVTDLVKRYYAAALAEDRAKACAMIYSTLSEGVAEDYGQASAGPPYLRAGKTCSEVMVLLFKHSHNQLAAEVPKLKVSRVRLNGRRGWAVLSFGSLPEREISVGREGHTWKVSMLIDDELP